MEWGQSEGFPLTQTSVTFLPSSFLMICLTNSKLWFGIHLNQFRIHLNQFGIITLVFL